MGEPRGGRTARWRINAKSPEPAGVQWAASILREGGLVALPTDTVYGLCCNALVESAVAAVYQAKGRPASMPLILLLPGERAMHMYADEVPPAATRAAATWWPGPLTIVLRRNESVPPFVVARGKSVGLRVPGHAVALAVLNACDFPVAGTSANMSGRPSPVHAPAQHDLLREPRLVLDAGPCPLECESTVVDFSRSPALLLREGAITLADLDVILGDGSVRRP